MAEEIMYVAEYHPKMGFHVELKSEKLKRVLLAIVDKDFSNEPFWMVFFEGTSQECNDACYKLGKEIGIYTEVESEIK